MKASSSLTGSLAVAVITALMLGAAGPAAAETPVRSGSILGGVYSTGPWQCWATPDCALWRASDCDLDVLSAREPALFTSIVEVGELAGSRTKWRFAVDLQEWMPYAGGLILEFWDANCERIQPAGTEQPYVMGRISWDVTFRFPSGTKWMTVVSSDCVLVDWALWEGR